MLAARAGATSGLRPGSKGEDMDDMQLLAAARHINAVFTRNNEDEDGDRHLASEGYALEAIDAALELEDPTQSPVFRQFMEVTI
jgi:hypothetical protein